MEKLVATLICTLARLITGVRAIWRCNTFSARQRVYFANHRSHVDFVLIWATLPPVMRDQTRPVARADYWERGPLRRYIVQRVFRGLLIQRASDAKPNESTPAPEGINPIEQMLQALGHGDSLIIFPEGTRNTAEELLPFKSGLFHLTQARPDVEYVPVWIENLGRVMPKGTLIPVPLLCSLCFGSPLTLIPGEDRTAFLQRARQALLALAPDNGSPHESQ